jgi:hypothetical protein
MYFNIVSGGSLVNQPLQAHKRVTFERVNPYKCTGGSPFERINPYKEGHLVNPYKCRGGLLFERVNPYKESHFLIGSTPTSAQEGHLLRGWVNPSLFESPTSAQESHLLRGWVNPSLFESPTSAQEGHFLRGSTPTRRVTF